MKRFLVKLSTFSLPVVILYFIAGPLLYASYQYYYSMVKYKLNKYSNEKNLILGSSHSHFGINTHFLNENYFNLANISQSYQEDYQLLKYLDKRVKIDTVLVSYSAFSSNYILRSGEESFRIYDYFFCQNGNVFINYFRDPLAFEKALQLLNYCLWNAPDFIDDKGNYTGDESNSTGEEELKADAHVAAMQHFEFLQQQGEEGLAYLVKIMDYCSENDIELIVVTIPVNKYYREEMETQHFEKYWAANKDKIKRITESYHFIYLDFEDYFGDASFFRDAHHLNHQGSAIFSEALYKQIRKKD